ncbi:MAG: protein kinase, partial [Acidobacteriota bacterium]
MTERITTGCPTCSSEVPKDSSFCPTCGTAVGDASESPTATSPVDLIGHGPLAEASSAGGSWDAARFLPGTVIAGRYRIIGLLGKGGMGEVYRADDLKLGQPVALKFLPPALERDPALLTRLLNEVRLARQVSHPNVCRVYDVGEVDGHHFLSMEYVDGDDLGSLIRQIGRLPRDKAVQIARQLCAGLAAAHDQGILHRDLKPSNVMIDGRGRVRITDFGLAGLAGEIRGEEVRIGTPAYMAPEQLAGRDVSRSSDLYALGLVLYELFTGKRAFEAKTPAELRRLHELSSPTTPSSLVEGFDPAVESVILRCLSRDPRERPGSALAVAGALPGGDPLAAALAAGETPAPEIVAQAGGAGGLAPWIAAACLGLVVAGLVLQFALGAAFPELGGIVRRVPLDRSPAVLERNAQELLARVGYPEAPADTAWGFRKDTDYLQYIEHNDRSAERWDRLASGRPAAVHFWYRQSPRPMRPQSGLATRVTQTDPPHDLSSMATISLDTAGRLLHLRVVPDQFVQDDAPADEPDWMALFAAAGFDSADFTEVEPRWTPPDFADRRAAWEGVRPSSPDIPIRIEAAAYRGRPTFFMISDPWTQPTRMQESAFSTRMRPALTFQIALFLIVVAGSALLARRNLRLGRGDKSGARRLALFIVLIVMLDWSLTASHVMDFTGELELLINGVSLALILAGLTWLLYVALEPFLRRRWPQSLVSWSRLLAGRLRDPLVGRDLLAGMATFAVLYGVLTPAGLLPRLLGLPTPNPTWSDSGLYEL